VKPILVQTQILFVYRFGVSHVGHSGSISGNLSGSISGNLSGSISGNLSGSISGNVPWKLTGEKYIRWLLSKVGVIVASLDIYDIFSSGAKE
jgi:hypothetical protein